MDSQPAPQPATATAPTPIPAPVPARRRRAHPAEKKRQIVEAAYELFGERGYHAINVADIARHVGMSHGTFYRHFESKFDVFQHIIGDVLARVQSLLSGEDPDGPDTLEEYRALAQRIGNRLYDAFMSDPHLSQLLFIESVGIEKELNERIRQAFAVAGQIGQLYIANGVRKGFLRPGLNAEKAALAINAMILEAARNARDAEDPDRERREWIDTVVTMIVDGMANRERR